MGLPAVGDSFFVPNPDTGTPHLYVIVAILFTKQYGITFNFSTYNPTKPLFDPACEVRPGEHPRLTERSFVVYSKGRQLPFAKWDGVVQACNGLTARAPLALVHKIIAGSQQSERISPALKAELSPFVTPPPSST